jgi:hypothetical protein
MGQKQTASSESAILGRVILPDRSDFTADLARAILGLDFAEQDRRRMHDLAAKAREGTLTAAEKEVVGCYERVGAFLSLLQAKARRALKHSRGPRTRSNGSGP